MDALEVRGDFKFDIGLRTIRPYLQRSGIHIFLISFACVYYVSNAPLLLGHYDLGWHLAAGDLIRERGNIPPMIHGHLPSETGNGSICPGFGTWLPVYCFNIPDLVVSHYS